jgi:antitoxin VapB
MYIRTYILRAKVKVISMKVAKVFKNGNSQAVRIPKEFHICDDELVIKRVGHTILLFPKNDPWRSFKNSLQEFSDDYFADGRNQPDLQTRTVVFDE